MTEKLSTLRAQTQSYLSPQEARALKAALAQFTQDKVVQDIVWIGNALSHWRT